MADNWDAVLAPEPTWNDVLAPAKRTTGQRFTENLVEGFQRSPLVSAVRTAYINVSPTKLTGVGPMANILDATGANPSLLDVIPGAKAGLNVAGLISRILPKNPIVPNAGDIVQAEKERRATYAAKSAEDPFYKAGSIPATAGAGLATLAGQVVGASGDPSNFMAPFSAPAKTVLARMGQGAIENAVAGAVSDVQSQNADVASGVQDKYQPEQTAISAGTGGLLGGILRGLSKAPKVGAKPKTPDTVPVWRAMDADHPVEILGRPQAMADGRSMVPVRNKTTGENVHVPADEIVQVPKGKATPLNLSESWSDLGTGAPAILTASEPAPTLAATKAPLREVLTPQAIAATDPNNLPALDASVSDLARDLQTALGLTHRQGRLDRGNVGQFNTGTGVTRTKSVHELDVLSHEGGHALEQQAGPNVQKALMDYAPHLETLAYDDADPKALRQEGFGEFFRWYLTNPDHAKAISPDFYDAFETGLRADNPDLAAKLQGVQQGYKTYLSAPSTVVAASNIVQHQKEGAFPAVDRLAEIAKTEGPGAAAADLANSAYSGFVDRLDPIARVEERLVDAASKRLGKPIELKVAESPYKLARLGPNAYSAGHMDIMHGVSRYGELDPSSPGLAQGLAEALEPRKWTPESTQQFDAYLAARRMIGEWDRYDQGLIDNPPDKITKAAYEQAVKDFEAANPTWNSAADKVYDFQKALWRKKLDAGLISPETYDQGLEHVDYVPALRDMEDRGITSMGRTGTGKFDGGAKRFRGSTRDIISPTQAMMRDAYRTAALISRNDAIKALATLADQAGPEGGPLVERIPAHELRGQEVDPFEAIKLAAKQQGMDERDIATLLEDAEAKLGKDATATVFRAGDINEKGEPIVYLWENGKRVPLRLADGKFGLEMFDALTNMTPEQKTLWTSLASIPARLLRTGIVTDPSFVLRNLFVDQFTTFMNTDVGFKPFVDATRGAIDELTQSKITQDYNRAQGIVGGAQTAAERDARIDQAIKELRLKGYHARVYKGWKGFAKAAEFSETATRLGVFRAALEKATKMGMSPREAALEAAYAATDYMDYNRAPKSGGVRTAEKAVPFLRSYVLGMDKLAQTLGADGDLKNVLSPLGIGKVPDTEAGRSALRKARKAWLTVGALSTMSLGLRALNEGDQEYDEVNDQLRGSHWVVKIGDHWAFIPKPQEWGLFPDIAERVFERYATRDPMAWKRLGSDMAQLLFPPIEAPIVKLPVELATNRSSLGQPIVPDNLTNVEPYLQVAPNTSEFSKGAGASWIGKKLHISPAVLDHIITGVLGTGGRTALAGSEIFASQKAPIALTPEDTFIVKRFVKDPSRSSRSAGQFWDELSQDNGDMVKAENTFRTLMNEDKGAAMAYLQKATPADRSYVMMSVFGEGPMKQAHPMIRAQKAVSVISSMRKDLLDGDILGPDGQVIQITPEQRREADTALRGLAMAEQHNALAMSGVEGWAQRPLMSLGNYTEKLTDADRRLQAALDLRMAVDQVANPVGAAAVWAEMRPTLEGQFQNLSAMIDSKGAKGREGARRAVREVTPAQR